MPAAVRLALAIALFLSLSIGALIARAHADEPLPTNPFLTLPAARRVSAAAEAGTLVVLDRLDGTQIASVEVAIAKARTAAIFRRPSGVFEDQVKNGRIAARALPGAAALRGGVPLIYQGHVVGAIGVSGDSPQIDEDIARVGAAALRAN